MGYDDNSPLTGVTGGGLPAEIWHEVMVRINEGVDPSPLLTEVPDSTYIPVDPSTLDGAIAPEDVPYFDDPNAPTYNEGFYPEPLPEAYTAPLPLGAGEPLPPGTIVTEDGRVLTLIGPVD
jgi:penicillin-binding protein 1A